MTAPGPGAAQLAYATVCAGKCEVDTLLGTVKFDAPMRLTTGEHGQLMAETEDGQFAGMFSRPWRVRAR